MDIQAAGSVTVTCAAMAAQCKCASRARCKCESRFKCQSRCKWQLKEKARATQTDTAVRGWAWTKGFIPKGRAQPRALRVEQGLDCAGGNFACTIGHVVGHLKDIGSASSCVGGAGAGAGGGAHVGGGGQGQGGQGACHCCRRRGLRRC
jgi:hypothetical protein